MLLRAAAALAGLGVGLSWDNAVSGRGYFYIQSVGLLGLIGLGLIRFGLIGRGTGDRLLDEGAAIEHVAPHHDAQRAVGPALRLERRLVAIGELENRQLGGNYVARVVELDGAEIAVGNRYQTLARAALLSLGGAPSGLQVMIGEASERP